MKRYAEKYLDHYIPEREFIENCCRDPKTGEWWGVEKTCKVLYECGILQRNEEEDRWQHYIEGSGYYYVLRSRLPDDFPLTPEMEGQIYVPVEACADKESTDNKAS